MDVKKRQRLSDMLELFIVLSLIFLCIVLTVPIAIWEEEAIAEKEAHFRMSTISSIQTFYQTLTGSYEDDGFRAMSVVNAVRDSVVADSTFLGQQILHLLGTEMLVDIPTGFNVEVDTTFGFQRSRRDTINDTTVTYLKYGLNSVSEIDRSLIDTSYSPIGQLSNVMEDSLFIKVVSQEPVQRVELTTYYDTYTPDSSFFYCPVTSNQFVAKVENEGFRISSPITEFVKEPRYFIFSFRAYNHGYIEDGATSWD